MLTKLLAWVFLQLTGAPISGGAGITLYDAKCVRCGKTWVDDWEDNFTLCEDCVGFEEILGHNLDDCSCLNNAGNHCGGRPIKWLLASTGTPHIRFGRIMPFCQRHWNDLYEEVEGHSLITKEEALTYIIMEEPNV